MTVEIYLGEEFKRQFRRLAKIISRACWQVCSDCKSFCRKYASPSHVPQQSVGRLFYTGTK